MMKVLKWEGDMPMQYANGDVEGGDVVDADVPMFAHRKTDNGIVNANDYTRFFIDKNGTKHLVNNDGWQELECNFNDVVVKKNGLWTVSNTLIAMQYDAIDAHILATIKQQGDYDSLGELELYRNNSEFYKPEAQALIDWVLVCHGIQSSIMTGEQQFDSVDDAIAALPKF